MRFISLIILVSLVGCKSADKTPKGITLDVTVEIVDGNATEEVENDDTDTDTDTDTDAIVDTGDTDTDAIVDTGDTAEPVEEEPALPVDPCDVELEMWSNNGSATMIVGAAPSIQMVSNNNFELETGYDASISTGIDISSLRGCGSVEILGVQTTLRRQDETMFYFPQSLTLTDSLYGDMGSGFVSYDAPVKSSYNSQNPDNAYLTWSAWDSEFGPSDRYGEFDSFVIEAHEVKTMHFLNTLPSTLPSGTYEVMHTLKWRDLETGSVVEYQNLDNEFQTVTLYDPEPTSTPVENDLVVSLDSAWQLHDTVRGTRNVPTSRYNFTNNGDTTMTIQEVNMKAFLSTTGLGDFTSGSIYASDLITSCNLVNSSTGNIVSGPSPVYPSGDLNFRDDFMIDVGETQVLDVICNIAGQTNGNSVTYIALDITSSTDVVAYDGDSNNVTATLLNGLNSDQDIVLAVHDHGEVNLAFGPYWPSNTSYGSNESVLAAEYSVRATIEAVQVKQLSFWVGTTNPTSIDYLTLRYVDGDGATINSSQSMALDHTVNFWFNNLEATIENNATIQVFVNTNSWVTTNDTFSVILNTSEAKFVGSSSGVNLTSVPSNDIISAEFTAQ